MTINLARNLKARTDLRNWIADERAKYADIKYREDGPNLAMLIAAMKDHGWSPEWLNFTLNYIRRAELFGADTPQGRQALGKAIVTLMHTLETAIEVYGDMPEPGFPSGEIR